MLTPSLGASSTPRLAAHPAPLRHHWEISQNCSMASSRMEKEVRKVVPAWFGSTQGARPGTPPAGAGCAVLGAGVLRLLCQREPVPRSADSGESAGTGRKTSLACGESKPALPAARMGE